MLIKIFFLFALLSLAEFYILIKIGQAVGAWETLALLVIIGLAGAALTRSQGLAAVEKFHSALQRGQAPAAEIIDGLLILLGGALLAIPGALTDALGLTLLFPFTRKFYRRRLIAWIMRDIQRGPAGGFYFSSWASRREDGVIDI